MKNMKRLVSLFLTVLTLSSFFTFSASAASSGTDWPSDVSENNYIELKAATTIYCYLDAELTTRGSSGKAYNSYISPGDLVYVYNFTSCGSAIVSFPTSSGVRRTAYVKVSSLCGVSNPLESATATVRITTYSDVNRTASYGAVYKGETVLKLGSSGSGQLILYPAKSGSGNRGYKIAWIAKTTYSTYFDPVSTTASSSASVSHAVPVYRQFDSRWANTKIGTKSIKQIGCLLTSLSMVYSYETRTTITPSVMKSKLSFSNNDLVWSSLTKLGYTRTAYNCSINQAVLEKIYTALREGPVIIGARNSSGGQHWVVISGYSGSAASLSASSFTIVDPNSTARTTLAQFLSAYPTVKGIIT